jgi:NAD(P)-dependent dehydrogenase (short-subunit alcohol dehydrogenase family)
VRSEDSIRTAVEAAVAVGPLDVLVANAGCNVRTPALEITWDDWNTVLDTNLRGTFFTVQAVARHMLPLGRGRIVTIGSLTSVFGYAGLAPYCASRGGVKQLTMSLADEFGPQGITVNCIAPGWFRTAQNDVLYRDEAWVASLTDRIPLRRPGRADDLDGIVVFLASDASGYITGQTLLVDGGMSTGAVRALPRPR